MWGYRKARLVIWLAFAMNFFVVLFGQLLVWMPAAPFWDGAEHFNYIYWNSTSGSRKVILRKVRSSSYEPVTGPTFTICSGNGTTPYKVKNDDGTTTELKDLPSLSSGVFWSGVLPYGDYTIRESNDESFALHVGDDTADASGVTIAPGSRDGVVIKGPN